MNKQEAIRKLEGENYGVRPGQAFNVRRMEPGRRLGVARCFFTVYGENYPTINITFRRG